MENGQKSISDLFESRRIFNIPKYQRAYAWEAKQLKDFINDLDNQNLDKDYFLGTILLQVRDTEGHFKIIDIVDGQQRITTLTVFMRVLLDKLASQGDDVSILRETYVQYRNEYKLRVLEYDQDFFRKCVLEDSEQAEKLIQTPSQRRLLNAKTFFVDELEKRSLDTLREYREKIENAKVLTYAVVNNAEATLIFETTNDRGKPLSNLEKIKSFLMYKVYISANNPEDYLRKIQDRFGEMYRQYEELVQHLSIDENSILRYHYITFEAKLKTENQENYTNHLWLVKDKINSLTARQSTFSEATKFIDLYSEQLQETFVLLNKLSKNIKGYLLNLFDLDRIANFFPLLLVSIKYDATPNLSEFRRITKLLEIISFRVYGIRRRKLNNAVLLNRLHELAQTFTGDFGSLISSLQDIVGEFCSDREFQSRLTSPTLYDDITTNDLGYLLWQYENHLRRTEFAGDTQTRFRQYRGLSIEHIISQVPREVAAWMDEEFWSTYIHSIGNLALDFSWENSAKSNLNFSEKYQHFYQHSTFRCQQELVKFIDSTTNEWDVSSIKARRHKIVNFAMKFWNNKNIGVLPERITAGSKSKYPVVNTQENEEHDQPRNSDNLEEE